jgi:hypothetical protein
MVRLAFPSSAARWSGLAKMRSRLNARDWRRTRTTPWYQWLLRRAKTGVPVSSLDVQSTCAITPTFASELLVRPGKRYFFAPSLPAPKSVGNVGSSSNRTSPASASSRRLKLKPAYLLLSPLSPARSLDVLDCSRMSARRARACQPWDGPYSDCIENTLVADF